MNQEYCKGKGKSWMWVDGGGGKLQGEYAGAPRLHGGRGKTAVGAYAGPVVGNKKGKVDGELDMDVNPEQTLINLGKGG
jgi:hypothetical protein